MKCVLPMCCVAIAAVLGTSTGRGVEASPGPAAVPQWRGLLRQAEQAPTPLQHYLEIAAQVCPTKPAVQISGPWLHEDKKYIVALVSKSLNDWDSGQQYKPTKADRGCLLLFLDLPKGSRLLLKTLVAPGHSARHQVYSAPTLLAPLLVDKSAPWLQVTRHFVTVKGAGSLQLELIRLARRRPVVVGTVKFTETESINESIGRDGSKSCDLSHPGFGEASGLAVTRVETNYYIKASICSQNKVVTRRWHYNSRRLVEVKGD